ncbi:MAG: sortase [Candidatus Woesebacteria bacterium]|nr:sortase [Candidatus Woesebacteria bacterium]
MKRKVIIRILAIIFFLSGLTIIFTILYPIFSYQIKNPPPLISPLWEDKTLKASTWFEDKIKPEDFIVSKIETYTLSIPKLGIKNAITTIGGEDLSKSLIHYPGTALPGRIGNSVIFGHSALPIFFSPTNYKTIFATLPTLKIGDEIIVNYDGITYRYVIEQMFDVLPTDIQILEQDNSDSFISLVTCIPPGDPRNPRRLIVRARIAS